MFVKPRMIWKETPNRTYILIITDVPIAPDTIVNLVKCNCTKSSWRLGQCICKKAKLYYTTLFACSLDNYVVRKIRKLVTSALWIQAMSKTRLFCFSRLLPLQRNKLFDLQCEAMGWFLCNMNFGMKWVKVLYFYHNSPNRCLTSKAPHHWVFTLK